MQANTRRTSPCPLLFILLTLVLAACGGGSGAGGGSNQTLHDLLAGTVVVNQANPAVVQAKKVGRSPFVEIPVLLVFLVLLLFYPHFDQDNSRIGVAVSAEIYILLALGLNVVVGFAGLLDLGYAAFFAIGAYSYGLAASSQFGIHLSFWPMLFVAAAIAALCTTDAVFITPTGIATGRQEIENSYKKLFAQLRSARDFVEPVDQVQALSSNMAVAVGHWTLQSPNLKGYWSEVYERQGQDWNIRLHAHNITPQAVPSSTSH